MDSFATKEQMADRSQGAIPADTPFLDTALAAASQEIRKYCHWHIAPQATTTARLRPWLRYQRQAILPSLHIDSLGEVIIGDETRDLTANPVDFDPDTGETDLSGARIVVTMTHGFEVIPEDLVELTLMIASRAMGAPLGYTREQSGQRSVSHSLTAQGVAGGTVLLEHEKASLSEYRLVTL